MAPIKPPTWREWKAQHGGRGWYWRAPLAVEWGLEWFSYRLRSLALFDLLELAGRATVLLAVIFWFLEAGDRAKERQYRAWELINAARGSTGDGGRKNAVQDLNKDGVSLAAAPLDQAYLPGVNLKNADLRAAKLENANLQGANLENANLQGANLEGADLQGANLKSTTLWNANLKRAVLVRTDLDGAQLINANLEDATLMGANLKGAILMHANLQGAILDDANLQGATLAAKADLDGAAVAGEADSRPPLRFLYKLTSSLAPLDPEDAKLLFSKLKDPPLKEADPDKERRRLELAQQQLDTALGDDRTVLPDGLSRPVHWPKRESNPTPAGATR